MKLIPKKKWECPPIHPANNAPPMSDAELAELAADIKAHGMHEPIVLWRDNSEEANGAEGPFPLYLLDGRNRIAALKLLSITDPYYAKHGDLVTTTVRTLSAIKEVSELSLVGGKLRSKWETDCEPYAFHTSMNAYRRHLTTDQRRWVIKRAIIENQIASDAKIGRKVKASDKTVAAVRAEMNVQNRETPKVEHHPIERAKEEARANPEAPIREIARKAKVSVGTAAQARKQLASEPIKPPPTPAPDLLPTVPLPVLADRIRSGIDRVKRAEKKHTEDVLGFLLECAGIADSEPEAFMPLLSSDDVCKLRSLVEWLNRLFGIIDGDDTYVGRDAEWDDICDELERKAVAAPETKDTDSSATLEWVEALGKDVKGAYLADGTGGSAYAITPHTINGKLTHHNVRFQPSPTYGWDGAKLIGRARAVDAAKEIAQQHSDKMKAKAV